MIDHVTGFVTGLVGVSLGAAGLLFALLAGLRMLWVVRRPDKGHVARGIAVAGLVLLLCGALLVTVEDRASDPLRAVSDRSALWVAGGAVLLALYVGYRSARRRARAARSAAPAEPAPRVELELEEPERPQAEAPQK
ncbi:MAG TPA: hypothetical protein VEB43_10450 [Anaeromyxobacter sp.]|nr:hypothetical protein [Anaeromyxobacter sp.]